MLINRKKNRLLNSVQQVIQSENKFLVQALRDKRSKTYLELIKKIDVGHENLSKKELEQMIQDLKQQFPVQENLNLLEGIVAKCFLGKEYEIHTLDMRLDIMMHYKFHEALPSNLEKARSLATSSFYAYIEVYSNYLCAVHTDGSVSIIGSDS